MSYSTPSAWRPEMRRRPTISSAFREAERDDRGDEHREALRRSPPRELVDHAPVRRGLAIAAPCDADGEHGRDDQRGTCTGAGSRAGGRTCGDTGRSRIQATGAPRRGAEDTNQRIPVRSTRRLRVFGEGALSADRRGQPAEAASSATDSERLDRAAQVRRRVQPAARADGWGAAPPSRRRARSRPTRR